MADIKYQRLTFARRRSFFSFAVSTRSSLWLGPDHLLCVDFNGYTETYKRFYFRDIQAITIRKTKRYGWWNAITGTVTLAFLVFIVIGIPKTPFNQWTSDDIAGGVTLSIITCLCIFLFVTNLIYGPTCKCFLRTAVQTENLPSLCRVRKTRKVLDQIRPLITAAQGGEIPADVASSWIRDSVVSAETPQNAAGGNAKAPPRLIS